MFGMVTRQSAELENAMNATERVLHYSSDALATEKAHFVPEKAPESSWPQTGAIKFDSCVLSYRKGLPPVLKGM